MTVRHPTRSKWSVLLAAAVVVVLSGTLAWRVAARATDREAPTPPVEPASSAAPAAPAPPAPPASPVPPPPVIALADLPTPFCWSCSWNAFHPSEFQIDLDLLAPLGDGPENAALWLRQFAKHDGERWSEYGSRTVERRDGGRTWQILPPNDPLLLEAEPWVDQARCRFYPDVWELQGLETPVPNLLFALHLARSWLARGHDAEDRAAAKEDYRRVVRLGRLLRQDDVTIIQDLIAIACIRLGVEALYEEARREGDGATMLAASLVLTDKDAMRSTAAQRITVSERIYRDLATGWLGTWSLETSDENVESVVDHARKISERRYRLEAMFALQVIAHEGTADQREAARAVLREFAATDDALLADSARLALERPLSGPELEMLAESTRP